MALLTFSTTVFSSTFLSSPDTDFSLDFFGTDTALLLLCSLLFSSLSGTFFLAAAAFLVSITFLLLSSFFNLLGGGVELLMTLGFEGMTFLAFDVDSFESGLTSTFLCFEVASLGFDFIL